MLQPDPADTELHARLIRLQPKIIAVTGRHRHVIREKRPKEFFAEGVAWQLPARASDEIGDDHFQTVYAACWGKRECYRGRWKDSLIMKIARNKWAEHHRGEKNARRREATSETAEQLIRDAKRRNWVARGKESAGIEIPADPNPSPEELAIQQERCMRLRRAFRTLCRKLPRKRRRVLRKRFEKNLLYREIASESGTELETVRNWSKRAIAKLRRDPALRRLANP